MSIPALHEFSKAPGIPSSQASPTRPKHLTTRSITEVSIPPSLPRVNQYKHHHRHPHIHHKSKERDPQSANQNLQPSVEGISKSEGHTPSESQNVSRRGSLFGDGAAGVGGGYASGSERRERVVREGEVREERERGVLRATELRNTLNNLNTLSNATTRRLDTTYYSVLEKLSMLQNTIASLHELSNLTRGLTESFSAEAQEVVDDVTGQVDGFDGFRDQEIRIAALKTRVEKGREKIKGLGGRVDAVRERVEGWEVAEGEWQEKTRKRLRILWAVVSVVAAVVLAMMAFQYTPTRAQGPGVMKGLNKSGLLGKIPDMEVLQNESWSLKRKVGDVLEEGLRNKDTEEETEDPRLRVFDEL